MPWNTILICYLIGFTLALYKYGLFTKNRNKNNENTNHL